MTGPPADAAGALGRAAVAGLLACAVLAGPAPGQTAEGAALDSVEAAVDSGRVAEALDALDRWMDDRFARAPADLRARARFLQARLAEDPAAARRAYALVAVEGGSEGARARLRLAQLHLAEGRHQRALEELETLRADVPGSALVAEAWLWTGRVREADGDGAGACEAYRRASEAVARASEGPREAVEAAREACRRGDGTPAYAAAGAAPPPGGAEAGADARTFAVQLGAFAAEASAENVRSRAAAEGLEARVSGPDPDDGLLRVRVGTFATEAEAEAAARRIEDRGFRAIVVEAEPGGRS